MTCANCEALREKVARLERELGVRLRAGEMGAVITELGVTPTQARILLRLYHARRWTTAEAMIEDGIADTGETVRSQISKLRRRVGYDVIESVKGMAGVGYRLAPPGAAKVLAAIQPVELQDVRAA